MDNVLYGKLKCCSLATGAEIIISYDCGCSRNIQARAAKSDNVISCDEGDITRLARRPCCLALWVISDWPRSMGI